MTAERTEHAADEVVALLGRLGLSREDTATVCFAVAVNHMHASGVTLARAQWALDALWALRVGGISERVLVPLTSKER